jgi:hypothetical protein
MNGACSWKGKQDFVGALEEKSVRKSLLDGMTLWKANIKKNSNKTVNDNWV